MHDLIDWANKNAGALNLLFAFVVALTAIVAILLNRQLVRETIALRKAETDPEIAVYLEPWKGLAGFFPHVIRNIGRGPAYHVSFDVQPKERPNDTTHIGAMAALRDGLKYLAPDQELRSFVGNYQQLESAVVSITVTYHGRPGRKQSRFVETFALDVTQFAGMRQLGTPPEREAVRHLKQIAAELKSMQSVWHGLHVHIDSIRRRPERWEPITSEAPIPPWKRPLALALRTLSKLRRAPR